MNIELPSIIDDNFVVFFVLIEAVIHYSDPDATIQVKRNSEGYMVHITPGNPDFRQDTINNLLFMHRHLKIPITFSSSLAISKRISYSIKLEEYLN